MKHDFTPKHQPMVTEALRSLPEKVSDSLPDLCSLLVFYFFYKMREGYYLTYTKFFLLVEKKKKKSLSVKSSIKCEKQAP